MPFEGNQMNAYQAYSIQEHLAEMTASRDEWRALAQESKQLLADQVKLRNDAIGLMHEATDELVAYKARLNIASFLLGLTSGFAAAWWILGVAR